MKRIIRNGWVALVGLAFLVTGCASYYKVTDTQTGKEYYTEEIDNVMGGAVRLKDARSGSIVTLQNSAVKEISSDEYKAGLLAPVSKTAPAPAAAAPAAAPAPAPAAAPEAAPAPAPEAEPSSAPSSTQ